MLIVIVIALAAIALDFAFRQLLLDQAQLRIVATADDIVRTVDAAQAAGEFEPIPVLATLSDRANLEHWSGPATYVQVDTLSGLPIGKSSNMGSLTIAPRLTFGPDERSIGIAPTGDGSRMLVLDHLLAIDGRPTAVVHVAERLDDVGLLLARARTILLWSTLGGIVLVVAASYVIAAGAVEPIERLTTAMAEIGSDRLDRRIVTGRSDEVGRLAAAFNAMLARLEEAFARERQFISDASHELKTPLTVINANAQLLRRWGDEAPAVRAESLDAIIAESQQLAGMVSGMLTLAKADAGDRIPKAPLQLDRLVSDVVHQARERAERKGLQIHVRIDAPGSVVRGDAVLLRQLITNLIDNALKFTEAGRIDVTLRATATAATIEVADSGVGITPETAERLFDRFFRGDASHSRAIEGTGLGLAIARSIARVHGGTVSAQPRPGGGSVFTVTLPAAEPTVIESQ